MSTPAHTFPCPFCGRRMGVRVEMLGRNVRCPHCSQVVLAPAPAPSPPEPAPVVKPEEPARQVSHSAPTPQAVPTPIPPGEGSGISFEQKREGADSILGDADESDDEVFSSQSAAKVPVLPDQGNKPPPPPLEVSNSQIPTLELRTPVDIVPAPVSASTLLPPPADEPVPPADPFAFDTAAQTVPQPAEPLPIPSTETAQATSTVEEPPPPIDRETATRSRRDRSVPAANGSKWSKRAILILAAYGVLMTILAVYGLFFKSSIDPGHPLSTIPDNFGEFDPASRKKVSQLKINLDAPLPADQRASLGQSIDIGQLHIEPVSVEKRPLHIIKEGKAAGDVPRRQSRYQALVLHLRIKNTSDSIPIFPMDPAFTRAARVDDKPATRLVFDHQTLYGGAIRWPFGDRVKREYEEAQAGDYEPLKPGESREYVVFTNEDSTIASAVRKATGPLLWRIQVRRGLVEFKGKDVPVTAIIGVEFQASQIQNLD